MVVPGPLPTMVEPVTDGKGDTVASTKDWFELDMIFYFHTMDITARTLLWCPRLRVLIAFASTIKFMEDSCPCDG